MLAGGYIASKWIYYQSEDILLIPLDWTHRSALSQESETLKLSLNSTISLFISKSRVNLGYPTWIPDRYRTFRLQTVLVLDWTWDRPGLWDPGSDLKDPNTEIYRSGRGRGVKPTRSDRLPTLGRTPPCLVLCTWIGVICPGGWYMGWTFPPAVKFCAISHLRDVRMGITLWGMGV